MDTAQELLRRVALNDEVAVAHVLTGDTADDMEGLLTPKVERLVELGALLAMGAAIASLRGAAQLATEAGASEEEIVGVLIVVGPSIGLGRLVTTAARLATAIGYDVDEIA